MYRNAFWNKDGIMLATWDKEGKRVRVKVPYKPYLYVDSPNGRYTSIFDTKVEKKTFENPFDRSKFVKNYGSKKFYENFEVTQQFLLDMYWQNNEKSDFAKYDLRLIMFDIEVDPLPHGEFPVPDQAKAEINILTAYDSLDQKYYVFSKKDYTGNNLLKDAIFTRCKDEKDLLRSFIAFWRRHDYPDIVTAWNLNGFDMPYVVNRIKKVLGDAAYYELSPYGVIREKEDFDKMGRPYTKYEVGGITIVDMIDIYAKFKITKQESYKLDFIAEMELGYGKVNYEGMTIYEFMEHDWNRFVEYNVQDVKLMVDIETKTRYFKIFRMIAYLGCVNFEKVLGTVATTNGAIAVRARQKGKLLHTFIRERNEDEEKPGGYVSSTPGFRNCVITYDASSLYPSITISNNISPETKVGMAYFENPLEPVYNRAEDEKCLLKLRNGKEYNMTYKQLKEFLKQFDFIISANGTIFSQKTQGVLAQFMDEIYAKRKATNNHKKKLQAENAKLEKELEYLKSLL